MSLRTNLWPVSLAVALLAGCGSPPGGPGTTVRPEASGGARILQADGESARGMAGHGSRFMARLGLTPGQKTRLQEIKADWPKGDRAQRDAWSDQFKTLLKAETLDQDALANLMTLVLEHVNQMAAKKVALADKARGVLTEKQRQQVAVAVLAHVAVRGAPEHGALELTAAQRAAFAWTKAMTTARKKAALASFMLTGETGALTEAWTVAAPREKAAQMAAAIASMTPAQRAALIAQMERAHAAMTDEAAPGL